MDDFVQLVKRAQTTDAQSRRQAFDALVSQFQGMAFGVAYTRLGDAHLAEDAVQDAFLTAYLQVDQLRDPQAFPAWVKRIVMTHCERAIRNKGIPVETIEMHSDLAHDHLNPEELVATHEIRAQVQSAIHALPEHERTVTEGFYMQGESQKEIAERLKIPVTTVKKRLQYARQHLRLLIGDLNAVVDQAIARVLSPQAQVQPQPIYLYTQDDLGHTDEDF